MPWAERAAILPRAPHPIGLASYLSSLLMRLLQHDRIALPEGTLIQYRRVQEIDGVDEVTIGPAAGPPKRVAA